ncbi:MAG TPA: SpoIID/LytB domain-containing protein, partial [Solirubrobacteraceae bacterium]|nr:SpoIID/LytB domain-containing protein [Solirubrobacteraceae bacterium]
TAPKVTFSGVSRAGERPLDPARTYTARAAGDIVELRSASGRLLARWRGVLTVGGTEAVQLAGPVPSGTTSGQWRGMLELRAGGGGELQAINVVDLESYVRGVVAGESPSDWPAEALKAQAVAARTYAVTTQKSGTFDHFADTRSQVYQGVAGETPTTDAAVAATADEVVTYDGRPVVTYFFSTSGGRTEDNENSQLGGRPAPWLRSVADPFDDASPHHRFGPRSWTARRAQDVLGGWVKGSLRSIEVVKRGTSPRIVRADVVGSGGRTTVSGAQLRARLDLPDTWAYFAMIATTARPGTDRVLSGAVRPGGAGNSVRVERRSAEGRWRKVTDVATRAGGRYTLTVDRPGRYRIVERGMPGPAVRMR